MVPSLTSRGELIGLDLFKEFWSHSKSFQKDELCAVGGSEALYQYFNHFNKESFHQIYTKEGSEE